MSTSENGNKMPGGNTSDGSMQEKLRRLGFERTPLGMRLAVGGVRINTAEGPFGLVIWFEAYTRRSMTQYQVTAPYICSDKAIAKLILVNVAQNFQNSFSHFIAHFEARGLSIS